MRSIPERTPKAKRARRTYHHGDLAEALLDAADTLVAEKGPLGFSLREAARMVNVDPAACYRHFRNKDALVQALARRGFTRFAAWMAAAVARVTQPSPERTLVAMAHAYVGFALAYPPAFRTMFGPTGVDARDALLRGDYQKESGAYRLLENAVAAWAQTLDRPVDVDAAAVCLWAGIHGISCLLIEGALRAEKKEQDRIVERLVRTLIAGLGQGEAPKTRARRLRSAKR